MSLSKLQFKHLTPYLPYKVLVRCGVGNTWNHKNEIMTISNLVHYEKQKMYLRPLSDLAQLIEINGENIIPFLELYKISIDEDIEEYKIVTSSNRPEIYTAGIRVLDSEGEYKILSFSISNGFATQNCGYKDVIEDRVVELTMNQFQLWEKLFEWHFDVFGLIEQGLAIDINTLNND